MIHKGQAYRTQPAASNRGFTLIEILISMSIIAIALMAANRMHSQTLTMANAGKFYTAAPLLAQAKMAEFHGKPKDELADDEGDFGEDHPGYTWKVTVADVESEILGETAEDLKQLNVSVFFGGDEFTFSTRKYLFARN